MKYKVVVVVETRRTDDPLLLEGVEKVTPQSIAEDLQEAFDEWFEDAVITATVEQVTEEKEGA